MNVIVRKQQMTFPTRYFGIIYLPNVFVLFTYFSDNTKKLIKILTRILSTMLSRML